MTKKYYKIEGADYKKIKPMIDKIEKMAVALFKGTMTGVGAAPAAKIDKKNLWDAIYSATGLNEGYNLTIIDKFAKDCEFIIIENNGVDESVCPGCGEAHDVAGPGVTIVDLNDSPAAQEALKKLFKGLTH